MFPGVSAVIAVGTATVAAADPAIAVGTATVAGVTGVGNDMIYPLNFLLF